MKKLNFKELLKKKSTLAILAVVVVLGLMFGLKPGKGPMEAQPVIVKKGNIVESVYGIGTLTALHSLTIRTGISSTISRLYVNEGDAVKKGDRLFDLEATSFRAPFDGTVVSLPYKIGENVNSQSTVALLIDLRETYLQVSLEQQGALRVKPGLPVKISFDGLRDQAFEGRVESIYSNTTDFLARISLSNLPKHILPGMTADVAIILREKQDAIIMPVAALDDKNAVVKRNGKIMRIPVEVGLVDGEYFEVAKGDVQVGDEAFVPKKGSP